MAGLTSKDNVLEDQRSYKTSWLKPITNVRFLMLVAALALLFSTACWASVFKGSYGDSDGYKNRAFAERGAVAGLWSPAGKGGLVAPYDDAQGLRVRGTGSVTGTPDLAVISLGVESIEDTASEARANAANAMAGVMQVLVDGGVAERDIQTRFFNISPRYQNVRVIDCGDEEEEKESLSSDQNCTTSWELKLIGYAVSNQASVNIRNLEEAGTIIDQVTGAAGDLVRVNDINFTIEEPESLREESRAKALAAMQKKAETMAGLAGVSLGRLVNLEEATDFYSPQPVYARAALASAESAADTSISAGEIEITTTVSGVYLIAPPTAQ